MSSGDALSSADGTQPPVENDEFDAGPAPEAPLPGFELPRLPDLPQLPDLQRLGDLSEADVAALLDAADDETPADDVPTPPQWPAVTSAEPALPPAVAAPTPPPAGTLSMRAQPPTRPARPTVHDAEPSLLGLTRRSRTKAGQLAFKWFFAAIFAVILLQLIITLLTGR